MLSFIPRPTIHTQSHTLIKMELYHILCLSHVQWPSPFSFFLPAATKSASSRAASQHPRQISSLIERPSVWAALTTRLSSVLSCPPHLPPQSALQHQHLKTSPSARIYSCQINGIFFFSDFIFSCAAVGVAVSRRHTDSCWYCEK